MSTPALNRRGLLGLSAAALAGVGLSACTGGGAGPAPAGGGNSKNLRFFTYRGEETIGLLREQIASFDEGAGVTTKIDTLPGSGAAQYPDKLRTQLLGGSGPDVWLIWGGRLGGPFVEAGQAADLAPYYEQFGWADRINANAIDGMTFDGVMGGVPTSASAIGIWYNKDLLEQAGADEPPASYDDLEALNADLVGAGITPCGLGGKYGWHLMRLFEYLLETTAGPELHDKLLVGEESWDTPEVVEAFTLFKKWQQEKWLPDGALGIDPEDIGPSFIQGKTAYSLEGTWIEQQIVMSDKPSDVFGTALAPTGHDPVRHSGFVQGYMMNANSGNPDKSAALIDFIAQAETQKALQSTDSTVDGAEPDASEFPLSAEWAEINKESPFYTIQDQAFPKEQSDQYFTVQSDLLQGSIEPAEAASRMDEIVSAWASQGN
jgi:raffinose/stachyose/melibiose transport system substrate-binding protein